MTADIEEMDRTINQSSICENRRGETLQSADLAAIAARSPSITAAAASRSRPISRACRPCRCRRCRCGAWCRTLSTMPCATGEREVSVAVRAEDGAVVLEVADRGPGIPAAEAERLKQPFTRLEVARSDKGGAGLGLAIRRARGAARTAQLRAASRAKAEASSRACPASELEGIEAPDGEVFSGTLRRDNSKGPS